MVSLFLLPKNNILPILLFLPMIIKAEGKMIYDFHEESSFRNWEIVDDGVMGGLSAGNLGIQRDGSGLFYGYVSLDNYRLLHFELVFYSLCYHQTFPLVL